jgi:hypothetical protein
MEATAFFDLWRSNQINLVVQSGFDGIERLSVWVAIHGEQTTPHAQELLRFFNQLAGTQHRLEPRGGNLREEAPDGSWRLDIAVYRLWVLDLGSDRFPLYACDEQMAEFLASTLEQARQQQRHALTPCPDGMGQHAGLRTILSYSTEHLSGLYIQDVHQGLRHKT